MVVWILDFGFFDWWFVCRFGWVVKWFGIYDLNWLSGFSLCFVGLIADGLLLLISLNR